MGLIFYLYKVRPTSFGRLDFLHSLKRYSKQFALLIIVSVCLFHLRVFWNHIPSNLNVLTLSIASPLIWIGGGSNMESIKQSHMSFVF